LIRRGVRDRVLIADLSGNIDGEAIDLVDAVWVVRRAAGALGHPGQFVAALFGAIARPE
jgi:hypothetical protein